MQDYQFWKISYNEGTTPQPDRADRILRTQQDNIAQRVCVCVKEQLKQWSDVRHNALYIINKQPNIGNLMLQNIGLLLLQITRSAWCDCTLLSETLRRIRSALFVYVIAPMSPAELRKSDGISSITMTDPNRRCVPSFTAAHQPTHTYIYKTVGFTRIFYKHDRFWSHTCTSLLNKVSLAFAPMRTQS